MSCPGDWSDARSLVWTTRVLIWGIRLLGFFYIMSSLFDVHIERDLDNHAEILVAQAHIQVVIFIAKNDNLEPEIRPIRHRAVPQFPRA